MILAAIEIPAQDRRHSQRAKKPVAHPRAARNLRPNSAGEQISIGLIHLKRAKDRVPLFEVEVIGIRKIGSLEQRNAAEDAHEARRIPIG
jgi:hypothetical protein